LLVSWCTGHRCDMAGSDEDHGRSRKPGLEDGDGQAQVGYSVAGQSRGQVMLCAVRTVHKEMRSASFLVWPQNQGRRFLPIWPKNQWLRVSWFGAQNWYLRFGDLGLKITVTVSWFGPQNQIGYGLSVVLQN
jgi:hypothetical protein